MHFENVSIVGLARKDAPIRVTSREIMERLAPTLDKYGVPPDMLENLTGIVARRIWDENTAYSDAAAMAGEKAITESGVDRSRIGIMINTSVCRDYAEPSTACLAHRLMDLPSTCMSYDLSNACLGFVNGMEIVGHMIERGVVDYGLVVDGEGSRYTMECTVKKILDPDCRVEMFRDNFATLTLGSGSGAMLLARSDLAPDAPRITGSVSLSATEHNRLCIGHMDGMTTDAHGLLVAGVELAARTFQVAKDELGWTEDCLTQAILHQVSGVHTDRFMKLVGLNDGQVYRSYPEYGNVGPANIPITLTLALEDDRIHKGDRVGVVGVGSGLNCIMMEIMW